MRTLFAILAAATIAHAQETPAPIVCPEKGQSDYSQIPFIDVEDSHFGEDGNFVVVIQRDGTLRLRDNQCYWRQWDEENDDHFEENFETFEDEGAPSCHNTLRSTTPWSVLRPAFMTLKPSPEDSPTLYRYESSVTCETEDTISVDDRTWTRKQVHEMPFYIDIPDEVDVEVDITNRLSQPTEDVDVVSFKFTRVLDPAGDLSEDDLTTLAEAQKAALEAIEQGDFTVGELADSVTVELTDAGEGNFEMTVTVVPNVEAQLYRDGRNPGQFYVESFSDSTFDAIKAAIPVSEDLSGFEVNGLGDVVVVEQENTVIFTYYTPEAIITNIDTESYRDEITITIEMQTSIERPWVLDFKRTNDETVTMEMTGTCEDDDGEEFDQSCIQYWTVVITGDSICETESDEIVLTFGPDLGPQVHEDYSTWESDALDDLVVSFRVQKDTYTCEVKLGEVTAESTLDVYETGAYETLKSDWRTWETAYFKAEVTTMVDLDILNTELVTLSLIQDEESTTLATGKAAVAPVLGQGRQEVVEAVYTNLDPTSHISLGTNVLCGAAEDEACDGENGCTLLDDADRQNLTKCYTACYNTMGCNYFATSESTGQCQLYTSCPATNTGGEEDTELFELDSRYTIMYSVLLDLDLFKPFVNLEPVDISFEMNIELTYLDLQDNRRRRLLEGNVDPETKTMKGRAKTGDQKLIPRTNDIDIYYINLNAGGHEHEHKEESSSEEKHKRLDVLPIILAASVLCLCLACLVGMFWMWHVSSLKFARIQTQMDAKKQQMGPQV